MKIQASRAEIILIASSGLFLGTVLYVYQAFGIDQGISFSGHSLLERVIYFTLGACFVFAINELLIKPFVKPVSIIQYVLWHVWETLTAGSFTYFLFNYFWNFTESTWYAYFLLLGEFTTVILIPIGLYHVIRRSAKSSLWVFSSENGKERIAIQRHELLYVKADDNYVKIVYRSAGSERSTTIRCKLSNVEIDFPELARVHRSFLVNPDTIHRIESKPKQSQIYFDTGSTIPVSSTYADSLQRLTIHP